LSTALVPVTALVDYRHCLTRADDAARFLPEANQEDAISGNNPLRVPAAPLSEEAAVPVAEDIGNLVPPMPALRTPGQEICRHLVPYELGVTRVLSGRRRRSAGAGC